MKFLQYRKDFLGEKTSFETQLNNSKLINEDFLENDTPFGDTYLGRLFNSTIQMAVTGYKHIRIPMLLKDLKTHLTNLVDRAKFEQITKEYPALYLKINLEEIKTCCVSNISDEEKLKILIGWDGVSPTYNPTNPIADISGFYEGRRMVNGSLVQAVYDRISESETRKKLEGTFNPSIVKQYLDALSKFIDELRKLAYEIMTPGSMTSSPSIETFSDELLGVLSGILKMNVSENKKPKFLSYNQFLNENEETQKFDSLEELKKLSSTIISKVKLNPTVDLKTSPEYQRLVTIFNNLTEEEKSKLSENDLLEPLQNLIGNTNERLSSNYYKYISYILEAVDAPEAPGTPKPRFSIKGDKVEPISTTSSKVEDEPTSTPPAPSETEKSKKTSPWTTTSTVPGSSSVTYTTPSTGTSTTTTTTTSGTSGPSVTPPSTGGSTSGVTTSTTSTTGTSTTTGSTTSGSSTTGLTGSTSGTSASTSGTTGTGTSTGTTGSTASSVISKDVKELWDVFFAKVDKVLPAELTQEEIEKLKNWSPSDIDTAYSIIKEPSPLIKIIKIFDKANSIYTMANIPSGRKDGAVWGITYRRYKYVGSGQPGGPKMPGSGPWVHLPLFKQWKRGVMDLMGQPEYKTIFKNISGLIEKYEKDVTKYEKIFEAGDMSGGGSKDALQNFFLDMLQLKNQGDFDTYVTQAVSKFFGMNINKKDVQSSKNVPIDSPQPDKNSIDANTYSWEAFKRTSFIDSDMNQFFAFPISDNRKRVGSVQNHHIIFIRPVKILPNNKVEVKFTYDRPSEILKVTSSKGGNIDVIKSWQTDGSVSTSNVYYGIMKNEFIDGFRICYANVGDGKIEKLETDLYGEPNTRSEPVFKFTNEKKKLINGKNESLYNAKLVFYDSRKNKVDISETAPDKINREISVQVSKLGKDIKIKDKGSLFEALDEKGKSQNFWR
jgi:hypothetical protein